MGGLYNALVAQIRPVVVIRWEMDLQATKNNCFMIIVGRDYLTRDRLTNQFTFMIDHPLADTSN